jgi:hypothetical protein
MRICAICFFIAVSSFPLRAFAAGDSWTRVSCEPLAALDSAIHFCSENARAARAAAACSAQLDRAWNEASKDLAAVEAGPAGQRQGYGRSQERYDTAVERLRALISATKHNADLVAKYPTVMVDDKGAESWADSLSCFREAYDQIQKTVTALDRKVAQARQVVAKAVKLRASVKHLADGVKGGSDPSVVLRAAGPAAGAPRVPASGRTPKASSDITGLRRDAGHE